MEYTRPVTWDDVATVVRYLEEAGVEYALVGGYAIRINDEFTIDVMPSIAGLTASILSRTLQPRSALLRRSRAERLGARRVGRRVAGHSLTTVEVY